MALSNALGSARELNPHLMPTTCLQGVVPSPFSTCAQQAARALQLPEDERSFRLTSQHSLTPGRRLLGSPSNDLVRAALLAGLDPILHDFALVLVDLMPFL